MRKIKPLRKGSLAGKVLRALGMHRGIELSLSSEEEKKYPGVSTYYDHIILRNAMLEAERLKAKALMEYRRRNLAR